MNLSFSHIRLINNKNKIIIKIIKILNKFKINNVVLLISRIKIFNKNINVSISILTRTNIFIFYLIELH